MRLVWAIQLMQAEAMQQQVIRLIILVQIL